GLFVREMGEAVVQVQLGEDALQVGAHAAQRQGAAPGLQPGGQLVDHADGGGGQAADVLAVQQHAQVGLVEQVVQFLVDQGDFRLLDEVGVVEADEGDGAVAADAQAALDEAALGLEDVEDGGGGLRGVLG